MSTRAKSRMSSSYRSADLTATTTILEEGEPADLDDQLDNRRKGNVNHYEPVDHRIVESADHRHQETELVKKLRQRIDNLETDAEASVPLSDFQRAQQEWQTSEDLLRESQRDNEQKHATIEKYKLYIKVDRSTQYWLDDADVKDLERIIDDTLGPNWKVDHQIRPPLSQSTCFSASTPLPKPSQSALRRSVSILPSAKRSSKIAARHVSASTFGPFSQGHLVFENKDIAEMDDTPTGAMRKLMGSSVRPQPPVKSADRAPSAAKPATLSIQTDPASMTATPRPAAVDHVTSATSAISMPQLSTEQVTALLSILAAPSDANNTSKAVPDTILLQTLERIEMAEKAAGEREARLRIMLEETRVASL